MVYGKNNDEPVIPGNFISFNGNLQYYEPYERALYEYSNNSIFKKKYHFDLGGSNDRESLLGIYEFPEDEPFDLGNIIETRDYIFAQFHYDRYGIYSFYSKKLKSSTDVIFNYDIIDHAFHNDIDGGMPFWPKTSTSNGKLISHFLPEIAKEKLKSAYFKSYDIKNKGGEAKFFKMMDSLGSIDNPVIQIVTLKN